MISHNAALVQDTVLAVKQIIDQPLFETILYLGALLGFVGMIFQYLQGGGKASGNGWKLYLIGFLILFLAIRIETDMAILDPVDATVYHVADAPLGLAVLGGTTSVVGNAFRTLFGTFMTAPSGTDVLGKGGVGRGLAILQGMHGAPWSDRSRDPTGDTTTYTDMEFSIQNYLSQCYAQAVASEGKGLSEFTLFHYGGSHGSLTQIWNRVRTDMVGVVQIKVRSLIPEGERITCRQAHPRIASELASDGFKEAIIDDMVEHLYRQIAAVSLPGTGVVRNPSTGEEVDTAVKRRLMIDARNIIQELFSGAAWDVSTARIVFLDRINLMLLSSYRLNPQLMHMEPEGRLASAWHDAQRQSDLSMAAQGDWFIRNAGPMTKLIEGLVIVFLPIYVFMMFFGQQGMKGITGSVGVLMWLQTWPVTYVIINHFTTHTVAANFEPFLSGTRSNELGMLDLYMIWDQARHSYAVSQAMLGMTPLLTGMLLSGSVMMLSKVASNLSSNESVDESRIHRNTESVAPIYQGAPSAAMNLSDQSSQVNFGSPNDPRATVYNAQGAVSSALTTTESRLEAEQQALTRTLQSAAAKAYRVGDMQTFNRIHEQLEGISDKSTLTMTADYSQASTEEKSRVEQVTARAAGELTASGGVDLSKKIDSKDKDKIQQLLNDASEGGEGAKRLATGLSANAGASLGISSQSAVALKEALSETSSWKQAVAENIETAEGVTLKDGFSVSSSLNNETTSSYSNTAAQQEQRIRQYSNLLANQRAAQRSFTASQTFDSGFVAQEMGHLFGAMEQAGSGLSGQEKIEAMAGSAQEHAGLSEEQGLRMATLMANDAHHDQLQRFRQTNFNMGWAGNNAEAYALYEVYKNTSRNQGDTNAGQTLVGSLITRTGFMGESPNGALNLFDKIPSESVTNDIGADVPQSDDPGLDKARNIEVPSDLSKREDANALLGRHQAAFARRDEAKKVMDDFYADQTAIINEKAGESTPMERFFGASGFGLSALDAGYYAPGKNLREMENYAGIGNSAEHARKEAIYRIGLAGAAVSDVESQGGDINAQRFEAIIQLAEAALRTDEQKEMNGMLENLDMSDMPAVLSALKPFEEKINERGLTTDPEALVSMASRITGSNVRGAGFSENMKSVGAAVKSLFGGEGGSPTAEANQMAQDVLDQARQFANNGDARLAVDDQQAIETFDKMLESLRARRERSDPGSNGSLAVSDVLLAQIQAMSEYADSTGQYGDFRAFMDEIRESAVPGASDGVVRSVLNTLATSSGTDGIAISHQKINEAAERFLGAGGYDQIRNEMPQELQQKIDQLLQEARDVYIDKRNATLLRPGSTQ